MSLGGISRVSSVLASYHDTLSVQILTVDHLASEPSSGERPLRHGAADVAEYSVCDSSSVTRT